MPSEFQQLGKMRPFTAGTFAALHTTLNEWVLGIPPGPPVRETLEALLEEVLDDPARNTRDRLLMRLEERRGAGEAPTANA